MARRLTDEERFFRSMTEGTLLSLVLSYLQGDLGILAWRNNTGAAVMQNVDSNGKARGKARFVRFGLEGHSDVFAIIPPHGRFLAIETKRETEQPTAAQLLFLENVRRAGGAALWVRPSNYQSAIDEALEGLGFHRTNE